MKLTSFSKGFWQSAVECKGANPNILRDYDIVKAREDGKTLGQIAIKYGLSEKRICEIVNKYK